MSPTTIWAFHHAQSTMSGTIIWAVGAAACVGPITSGGYNVSNDASCVVALPTDQLGVDPLLGPLGDNGGPTLTLLPGSASPAVDAIPAGTPGLCTAGLLDQRSVSRPQAQVDDVGAVERVP
jgi:hypothetical protein